MVQCTYLTKLWIEIVSLLWLGVHTWINERLSWHKSLSQFALGFFIYRKSYLNSGNECHLFKSEMGDGWKFFMSTLCNKSEISDGWKLYLLFQSNPEQLSWIWPFQWSLWECSDLCLSNLLKRYVKLKNKTNWFSVSEKSHFALTSWSIHNSLSPKNINSVRFSGFAHFVLD